MAMNINIDVNNENEFNQQLQMYLAQGYNMQSNFNGTAILKKKSYSLALLIILIIFFFPVAIIYYLVASDDIVTITNKSVQGSGDSTSKPFDGYCEECGHGLYKESKFCPGCGKNVSLEGIDEDENIPLCPNCGKEVSESNRFCPNCGKDLSEAEEEIVEEKLTCDECGEELLSEAKFCPNCGKDLTEQEEEENALLQ